MELVYLPTEQVKGFVEKSSRMFVKMSKTKQTLAIKRPDQTSDETALRALSCSVWRRGEDRVTMAHKGLWARESNRTDLPGGRDQLVR